MIGRPYNLEDDFGSLEKILRACRDVCIESDIDVLKFREKNLPPIIDVRDLSLFIGIGQDKIDSIRNEALKKEIHYRRIEISKKDGSKRIIYAPRTYLKVVQWWILDNILNRIDVNENIFGFVPKRNIIQNAKYHFGSKHILNVDIKDFFPSIKELQVNSVFMNLGYSYEVASMLAEICCLEHRVPQGAPTSPAIGNLVLVGMDKSLADISRSRGIKYSRYADDLTFSSTNWIDRNFLDIVIKIVNENEFKLNMKKTRFSGPQDRLEVTGVVINAKVQPPRKWRKRVRAILNEYRKRMWGTFTRRDISYLYGIIGVAKQYPDSTQMKRLGDEARYIIDFTRHKVVGYGYITKFPHSLTRLQVQVLLELSPIRSNYDISKVMNISEQKVNKYLQNAFKKINVYTREQAILWVKENL